MDKETELLERNHMVLDKLRFAVGEYHSKRIGQREIFVGLCICRSDELSIAYVGDLWKIEIDFQSSFAALKNFDFSILDRPIVTDFGVIEDVVSAEDKAKIKSKGTIWFIYKTDKDSFPSNPHADNYEHNLKLHLGNGACYQNRRLLKKLRKEDLLDIRAKIADKGDFDLPKLEI